MFKALEAKEKSKGLELLRKLARKLQDKHIRCVQVLARGDPALELVQVVCAYVCVYVCTCACSCAHACARVHN